MCLVVHVARLLREVAERQSLKHQEQAFRANIQRDLEAHASFTHKVVTGKPLLSGVKRKHCMGSAAMQTNGLPFWRDSYALALDAFLEPVGTPVEFPSESIMLYLPEGDVLTLKQF